MFAKSRLLKFLLILGEVILEAGLFMSGFVFHGQSFGILRVDGTDVGVVVGSVEFGQIGG